MPKFISHQSTSKCLTPYCGQMKPILTKTHLLASLIFVMLALKIGVCSASHTETVGWQNLKSNGSVFRIV